MPDAPVATPAPSAPAPSTGGASESPKITFGGGTSGDVARPDAGRAGQDSAVGRTETTQAESPFEFKFDGDEETYREKPEAPEAQPEEKYDASKPFDPELRELLKDKPDKLKQVERNHFELRQWQRSGFKNAQEAAKHQQELGSLVQSLGRTDGLKGIEAVRAEAQEWATTMQGFQNGDPAVVDQWFADNPEGMSKLMGPAIMKFAETNPAAYAHEMSAVMAATLRSNGASGFSPLHAFNFLVEKFGKDAEGAKWLNVLSDAFNTILDTAKKPPQAEGVKSPQIEAKEKELANRERNLYQEKIAARNIPFRDSAVRQGITQAFKGMNLSADARADIEANVKRMLIEAQRKDEDYKRNGNALLNERNDDGFSKAYKSSVTRNLPGILRRIRRTYSGITAGERKAEGQSRTEAGGAVQSGAPQKMPYSGRIVNGGPPPDQIDYPAMRAKFGREGVGEALSRHEFIWKGKDPRTVYTW